MNRRLLLRGALTLLAAPAIVRIGSLMPVKSLSLVAPQWWVLTNLPASYPWSKVSNNDLLNRIMQDEAAPLEIYGGALYP